MKKYSIAVIGIGYVGEAITLSLAEHHKINVYDINKDVLTMIENNISPTHDKNLNNLYLDFQKNINVCHSLKDAVLDADYVFISTPTDYIEDKHSFDTSSVKETIKETLKYNHDINIIVKSTVNIGFTSEMIKEFNYERIFFVPEFLREGSSYSDMMQPTRIIIGSDLKQDSNQIVYSLMLLLNKNNAKMMVMSNQEAEAVKLFSNSYLAMRVSFFNELDSYAETNNLSSRNIIKGVCLDPRIGDHYNNPSFGYGGYCLPKDSKQLRQSFGDIPNSQINAIVEANQVRKQYIADKIISKLNSKDDVVGVYRLTMKKDSNNFRFSSIIDVMNLLNNKGINLVIYEPNISDDEFENIKVIHDLEAFKTKSNLIIANRYDSVLNDVKEKVYTRDLFNKN